MKLLTFLFFFFMIFQTLSVNAQLGLNVSYTNETLPEMKLEEIRDVGSVAAIVSALSYEISIPNYRVNFYPSLAVARSINHAGIFDQDLNQYRYGVGLPIKFYVLDIEGDCNCPTFSQRSDFFAKGFFFELMAAHWLTRTEIDLKDDIQSGTSTEFGLGAGLDIGLSDRFTFCIFGRSTWVLNHSLNKISDLESVDAQYSRAWYAGIEMRYYLN